MCLYGTWYSSLVLQPFARGSYKNHPQPFSFKISSDFLQAVDLESRPSHYLLHSYDAVGSSSSDGTENMLHFRCSNGVAEDSDLLGCDVCCWDHSKRRKVLSQWHSFTAQQTCIFNRRASFITEGQNSWWDLRFIPTSAHRMGTGPPSLSNRSCKRFSWR